MNLSHSFIDFSYFLIRTCLGPIVRLVWIKRVSGLKTIPSKGPVILVFNHQSYFDFICFIAVSPRNVHYLSAEKFFRHPIWSIAMKITGQIPVDRIAKDKHELHESVHHHLDEGKMVGIFPEGTRSPHQHEMLKGYSGVIRYAIRKRAPVIPVGIKGAYEVMSRHDRFPRFKKNIEIVVGKPALFNEYDDETLDLKTREKLMHGIMLEISELSGKTYPHVTTS